jgi:hypothetical protein
MVMGKFGDWVLSWSLKTWVVAVGLLLLAVLAFVAPDRIELVLKALGALIGLAG